MNTNEIAQIKNQIQILNQASLTANAKIEIAKKRLDEIFATHQVTSVEELQAKATAKEQYVSKLMAAAREFIDKRNAELDEINGPIQEVQ